MLPFQPSAGLLGVLPDDQTPYGGGPNNTGYMQPNGAASLTPQTAPPTLPSGAQLLANANPVTNGATPQGAAPAPVSPPAAPVVAPAPPNLLQSLQGAAGLPATPTSWQQRVQGVAGLPTGQPLSWQQRVQALGQGARTPQQPSAPLFVPQAQQPAMNPQQMQSLLQRYPQLAQRFGMIGATAPQPGPALPPRPAGGYAGGVMQPGGIGGAGPIPAPGYPQANFPQF